MVQKSSYFKTLEVFFTEPTNLHFVKEISRKIKIAPTSIKKNIQLLLKENLIIKKESKPFDGYVANRNNQKFIFLKKVYNLFSLEEIKDFVQKNISPKLFIVFGSYSLGEDIENSDIDLFILSKIKKLDLTKFEKNLKREINLIILKDFKDLEKPLQNKVHNGILLSGGYDE
jgi:predicted nucleotidyltransferase